MAPLVSVITTLYYAVIIFHRRVCYRVFFLRYAWIRTSKATFVPNFISFATSIAQLAQGQNHVLIHYQAYLMPQEPKLALRNKHAKLFTSFLSAEVLSIHHPFTISSSVRLRGYF